MLSIRNVFVELPFEVLSHSLDWLSFPQVCRLLQLCRQMNVGPVGRYMSTLRNVGRFRGYRSTQPDALSFVCSSEVVAMSALTELNLSNCSYLCDDVGVGRLLSSCPFRLESINISSTLLGKHTLKALSTTHRDSLRKFIANDRQWLKHNAHYMVEDWKPTMSTDFVELITSCSGLEHFSMDTSELGDFRPGDERNDSALRNILSCLSKLSSLTSLSLGIFHEDEGVSSSGAFLQHCRSDPDSFLRLTKLTLYIDSGSDIEQLAETSVGSRLEDLTLCAFYYQDHPMFSSRVTIGMLTPFPNLKRFSTEDISEFVPSFTAVHAITHLGLSDLRTVEYAKVLAEHGPYPTVRYLRLTMHLPFYESNDMLLGGNPVQADENITDIGRFLSITFPNVEHLHFVHTSVQDHIIQSIFDHATSIQVIVRRSEPALTETHFYRNGKRRQTRWTDDNSA